MKETIAKLLPLGAPDACIEAVGMHYTKSLLQTAEMTVRKSPIVAVLYQDG